MNPWVVLARDGVSNHQRTGSVRPGKVTQTETTTLLWPHYGIDNRIFDDLAPAAEFLIRNH
jgi:hypothetical protein